MHTTIASWLGYDATLIAGLGASQRDAIDWVAAGFLLGCGLVSAPPAYAVWLSAHSLPAAAGVGCVCFGLVLAIVRLRVASGGLVPARELRHQGSYSGPVLVLGLAAALAAQPAQLWLGRADVAQQVRGQRQALGTRFSAHYHARAPSEEAGARAAYWARVSQCEFMALRLQAIWSEPGRAVRYTLLYMGLVLIPGLVARLFAGSALRRYELRRAQAASASAARDARWMRQQVQSLLAKYPTYRPALDWPGAGHDPLRTPWATSRRETVAAAAPRPESVARAAPRRESAAGVAPRRDSGAGR
jgi:hypothetical protein